MQSVIQSKFKAECEEAKATPQNKYVAFSFNVYLGSSKSRNILYFMDPTPIQTSRRNWTTFSPKKKQFPGGIRVCIHTSHTSTSPASLNEERRDTKQLGCPPPKPQS